MSACVPQRGITRRRGGLTGVDASLERAKGWKGLRDELEDFILNNLEYLGVFPGAICKAAKVDVKVTNQDAFREPSKLLDSRFQSYHNRKEHG